MKFNFKNFGFIKEGSIEPGRLTILCGDNNTGKTYVNTALYMFYDYMVSLNFSSLLSRFIDFHEFEKRGFTVVNFKKISDDIDEIFSYLSFRIQNELHEYYSVPKEYFEKSEFVINDLNWDASNINIDSFSVTFQNNIISFDYDVQSSELKISVLNKKVLDSEESRAFIPFIDKLVFNLFILNKLLNPYFISSERSGVSLFYKELDLKSNKIIDLIKNSDADQSPFFILNKEESRYPRPINRNINQMRDFEQIWKRNSKLKEDNSPEYKNIRKRMKILLDGSYNINNSSLTLKSGKTKKEIPFYITSSASKSLFLLDMYIECQAQAGDILFIDEPELNLHPSNQIHIARVLASLVALGVNVMISTHSDYIIKEFNNLMQFSKLSKKKKEKFVVKSYPKIDKYFQDDRLHSDDLKVYSVNKDTREIEPVVVDEYGMDLKEIDRIILDINKLSRDLYFEDKK